MQNTDNESKSTVSVTTRPLRFSFHRFSNDLVTEPAPPTALFRLFTPRQGKAEIGNNRCMSTTYPLLALPCSPLPYFCNER